MGDLISRSALLQKFNDSGIQITFDLPVEEILGEDVDIDDFTMLVQDAIQAYKKMVIGTIKNMPTAYDVEKVVAKLEIEKEKVATEDYCRTKHYDENDCEHKDCFKCCAEYLIDIVRKGGVDNE